jgi:hypothetical protein
MRSRSGPGWARMKAQRRGCQGGLKLQRFGSRLLESMRGGSAARWTRPWWAALLTLFFLSFVAPGTSDLLGEVVACATGIDGCDDCCAEGGATCPAACMHCSCCAHATALPVAAGLALRAPAPEPRALGAQARASLASEHRMPPYRPPAA